MHVRSAPLLFAMTAAAALAAVLPVAAWAGTVCGTVRDGLTLAPIERAGVFVYEPGGPYAGFHSTTDVDGAFCIDGVPAGTYDLVVRRDDYQIAILRDVVVSDEVTGVDIGAIDRRAELAPPWPNPARGSVALRMQAREAGTLTLSILDPQGRLLRGWIVRLNAGEARTVAWDFRDHSGRSLAPGRYIARLSGDGWEVTRALMHVR